MAPRNFAEWQSTEWYSLERLSAKQYKNWAIWTVEKLWHLFCSVAFWVSFYEVSFCGVSFWWMPCYGVALCWMPFTTVILMNDILVSVILLNFILHCVILYNVILHGVILHNIIQHNVVLQISFFMVSFCLVTFWQNVTLINAILHFVVAHLTSQLFLFTSNRI
jgi:hypothetical protein